MLKLIITSFSDKEAALIVIRSLIQEQLIACGTLLPQAYSIYHWEGKIEETQEAIVFLKTTVTCLEKCTQRLKELHPYEVPEIIVLDPCAIEPSYLKWVEEVTDKNLRHR